MTTDPIDRTPPHDIVAETYTLACIMDSPAILTEVAEIILPSDFYRPAHGDLFKHMILIWTSGDPLTLVTLRDAVMADPDVSKGAAGLIVNLVGLPVSGIMGPAHARVVWKHAVRRRLIEVGSRTVQLGYELDFDPAETLARAQSELQTVARDVVTDDAGRLMNSDQFLGLDTTRTTPVIPGLLWHEERVIIVGVEGDGKALALDTPVPSPKGWTTMGELSPGDAVFAADGSPTRVTLATPARPGRECYAVRFSDGASIVTDGDHLWVTQTERERAKRQPGQVRSTREIAVTLRSRPDGHCWNHSVPVCGPLGYCSQELPVDPWLLGAWLGDGTADQGHLTAGEDDLPYVEARLAALDEQYRVHRYPGRAARVTVLGLKVRLRSLGVLGAKRIPGDYLYAGVHQRLELLRGLMDTDGTVCGRGLRGGRGYGSAKCELSLCNELLADDALELLTGMGIKVRRHAVPATLKGRVVGTRYRMAFQTELEVFGLPRKAERIVPLRTRRPMLRYIVAVDPAPSVPVRCIQVSDSSAMYLAGTQCIPTHNTTLGMQVGYAAAAGIHPFVPATQITPMHVMIIDLENPRHELQERVEFFTRLVKGLPGWNNRNLTILSRPAGVDLSSAHDRFYLAEKIRQVSPDLIVGGPLYKMVIERGDGSESTHSAVTRFWDVIRDRHGSALWFETHPPLHMVGKNRIMRPLGSGIYSRWPEFGINLMPGTAKQNQERPGIRILEGYRGHRNRKRVWPESIHPSRLPGLNWPWEAVWPQGTFTGQP